MALSVVLLQNLLNSRPGRAIPSAQGRRRVVMAEAMGARTAWLKVVCFLIAAVLASVSGWLYAHMQRSVNPTPFGLNAGIEYLFMAVIGGAGSVWAPSWLGTGAAAQGTSCRPCHACWRGRQLRDHCAGSLLVALLQLRPQRPRSLLVGWCRSAGAASSRRCHPLMPRFLPVRERPRAGETLLGSGRCAQGVWRAGGGQRHAL